MRALEAETNQHGLTWTRPTHTSGSKMMNGEDTRVHTRAHTHMHSWRGSAVRMQIEFGIMCMRRGLLFLIPLPPRTVFILQEAKATEYGVVGANDPGLSKRMAGRARRESLSENKRVLGRAGGTGGERGRNQETKYFLKWRKCKAFLRNEQLLSTQRLSH